LARLIPRSLQFRLTAGVTAASVIVIGAIAGWTGWQMQQILVNSRKENIVNVTRRAEQDAVMYAETMPRSQALQKAIDSRTTANLVLWVSNPDQQILVQSDSLATIPWQRDGMSAALFDLSGQTLLPGVRSIGGRYFVSCSRAIELEGEVVGQLYAAEDITRELNSLLLVLRTLGIASFLGALAIAFVIAWFIRRSLQPLRKMSQMAGKISAQDLDGSHLELKEAPAEVEELAQAFNNMLARLSLAWTQQRQFVSNISHELRTPLSLVHGYLQSILRRGQNLTPPQREGLEIAAAEADRTVQLLGDLLDLARADSGHLQLHRESFSLKDLALDLLDSSPEFCDRVQLEVQTPTLNIVADRKRLQQVLVHLLDNGVKYSAADQPVVLRLDREMDRMVIQVRDQGIGIPPEHLIHLFEPFYRVDEDRCRTTGGTGLGLSIVKTLVTCMGGQVGVQSAPGQGSIFTVTLPT
jgi:hypothetical protein